MMGIQINNNNSPEFINGNKLHFHSAEELGGSIFIYDSNNTVEVSDIQGNKFQSLIDLLMPAFEKNEEWTQELVNAVENLIKKHNTDKKNGIAEEEIETTGDGWTRTKKDIFGRPTEYINNDGRRRYKEWTIKNGRKIYTESFKDAQGNLLPIEYNGKQYAKITYEPSKIIGETLDGKKQVLQEILNDKINDYFYNENGDVIDIKVKDKEGNGIPLNYSGSRKEQYRQFFDELEDREDPNKPKIPGFRVGQEDLDTIRGNDQFWLLVHNMLDKHGNVVRFGNNVQEAGTYVQTENDKNNLEYVFGQTQFADNFIEHSQMLDAIDKAKEIGVSLDDVTVLINCDSHSDVYLNTNKIEENRANWVNACLAQNPSITDFYWVVTENMIEDKEFGEILNGQKEKNKGKIGALVQNIGIKADLKNGESVQTYYIDKGGNISLQKTESAQRPIRIHICTEKNLPDFEGQKIISSFDMDYFSNSGFDTTTQYRDNKTADELNIAFSQIVKTFADHHIQPILHGNCYSNIDENGNDTYLPEEDLEQVQQFSKAILEATPQKGEDILNEYKHNH